MLEWNTLFEIEAQIVPLNEAHILTIDIFDLPLMVLEIIEVKYNRGVRSLTRVLLY